MVLVDLSFLTGDFVAPKNGIGSEEGRVSVKDRRRCGLRFGVAHPCGLHRFVRGFVLGTAAVDLAIIAYGAINSSNAFRDAGWGLVASVPVVAAVAQHGVGEGTRIPSEAPSTTE
jgi:hypothetical protein